jgi:selenide,water dikinase
VSPEALLPLYDPQTSGGLLVAAPEDQVSALVSSLERYGVPGAVVGEVVEGSGVRVTR